jgi:peptidoglycan/LPS O-acetylase OafA/YrhL
MSPSSQVSAIEPAVCIVAKPQAAGNKPIPRPRAEIDSLTSLRGFLALWIVIYHFWNDVLCLFPSADVVSPLARVGDIAVPVFFMLSGFVLAYNYADRFGRLSASEVIQFQCRRLARIYPVHLFTLLIVAAMVWESSRAGYQLKDEGYTGRDFVLNLLLMHTWVPHFTLNWNYPSWSISSEWFAYLIFPLAVAGILRHLTTPRRAMFFCVFALAGAIVLRVWGRLWPFYDLLLVVPSFFAGAAVYWILLGRMETCSSKLWRWVPEVLVLAAGTSILTLESAPVEAALLCCFLGMIIVLVWLGKNCHLLWTVQPVVFLGEVSYSLYMTHTLVQKVVKRLLPSAQYESADTLTKLGVLTIYAVGVTVCCLCTYYCVERPCRRLFRTSMRRQANPKQVSA